MRCIERRCCINNSLSFASPTTYVRYFQQKKKLFISNWNITINFHVPHEYRCQSTTAAAAVVDVDVTAVAVAHCVPCNQPINLILSHSNISLPQKKDSNNAKTPKNTTKLLQKGSSFIAVVSWFRFCFNSTHFHLWFYLWFHLQSTITFFIPSLRAVFTSFVFIICNLFSFMRALSLYVFVQF